MSGELVGVLLFWGWVAFATVGLASAVAYAILATRGLDRVVRLKVQARR